MRKVRSNFEAKKGGVEVAKDAAGSDCSMGDRVQVLDLFGLGVMQAMA